MISLQLEPFVQVQALIAKIQGQAAPQVEAPKTE